MAFDQSHLENIANPGTSLKKSGKRRNRKFKVNWRKRGMAPYVFETAKSTGSLSDYVNNHLPEHMPATTARNNDGMSFVW